jgi:AcrR family transcriptional regulator
MNGSMRRRRPALRARSGNRGAVRLCSEDRMDTMTKTTGSREPLLSRDSIVSTALQLMDEHGVEWFSMRKLAQRLGVSPQALYWHFTSKDELCQAVVEAARDDIDLAIDLSDPPGERVKAVMRSMRAHLARHPATVDLGRYYLPPMAGEITEQGIAVMQAMGFSTRTEALRRFRALVWTVVGFAQIEHGAQSSVHHTRVMGEHSVYEVRIRSGEDDADTPEVAGEVVDVDALFDDVVEIFVAGLESALRSGVARRSR